MKIMNNSKFDFRYACIAFTLLLYLYPDFLFSQNTATASGNWNDCNSWGNPPAIFRNTTDTKTINNGITITENENWSTGALQLNGNGAVNFNGNIVLDFTQDQGADKSCEIECGANIGAGVWKKFMCHNLGADYSANPFIPSAAIHGAKYQWGRSTPAVTQSQDQANPGAMGLNTSYAPDGSWQNGVKTGNDPCPNGYRVPSRQEWDGVVTYNSITKLGTWVNSATNYSSALKFGNSLVLVSVGHRSAINSFAVVNRGVYGLYWGAGEQYPTGNNGDRLVITGIPDAYSSSGAYTTNGVIRSTAIAVRCIAQ